MPFGQGALSWHWNPLGPYFSPSRLFTPSSLHVRYQVPQGIPGLGLTNRVILGPRGGVLVVGWWPFRDIVPVVSTAFLLHDYEGLNCQSGSEMHILVTQIVYIDKVL